MNTGAGRPRVVIANHDPLVRRGLRCLLDEHGAGTVIAEVRTDREALEATIRLRPDVLLLGVRHRMGEGLKILAGLNRLTRVVAFAHSDNVASAIRNCVAECLIHGEFTVPTLIRAITGTFSVTQNVRPLARRPSTQISDRLSRREAEVMDWIAQGMGNSEIARRLVLSEKTVKNHINSIFGKLGVRSRGQAIVLWLRPESPALAA